MEVEKYLFFFHIGKVKCILFKKLAASFGCNKYVAFERQQQCYQVH